MSDAIGDAVHAAFLAGFEAGVDHAKEHDDVSDICPRDSDGRREAESKWRRWQGDNSGHTTVAARYYYVA